MAVEVLINELYNSYKLPLMVHHDPVQAAMVDHIMMDYMYRTKRNNK